MTRVLALTLLALLSFMPFVAVHAQSPDGIWQQSLQLKKSSLDARNKSDDFSYNLQTASLLSLRSLLGKAPQEGGIQGIRFYYPLPNGEYIALKVYASPVMAPKLAAKYPKIRSYQVYGADDDSVSGRIGISSKGLFGYVRTRHGVVLVQPESDFSPAARTDLYRIFFRQAATLTADTTPLAMPTIHSETEQHRKNLNAPLSTATSIGRQVRVFRLAASLTGEATRLLGGTKERGLEFLVEAVNFLNFIYIREVGIRLELIENNDQLIFLNPDTDPFEIPNFAHTEINEYLKSPAGIPAEDYDIGHVINTHGGGQAAFAQLCIDRFKGQGRTGLGSNGFQTGSAQWKNRLVGVFAHEIGHQVGALHTQNSTCNRTASDAWEMHSGSTIMGYAGVCSPSLQPASDPILHAGSREKILSFLSRGGRLTCGTTETFDYEPPIINAGEDQFIPTATPFILTASVAGGSSASLTYTWDQMDLGGATTFNPATWKDDGAGPLFRSYAPTELPSRVFPNLEVALSDKLNSFSEILPTTGREINFRVTGRSGRGWGQDDIKLNVVENAGPFQVLKPIGTEFDNNQTLLVEWRVANTNSAPINCSHVDIDLSVNGGLSFDQSLVQQTPNDGAATVTLAAVADRAVRVRVKCSNNVFFAVSPASDPNANTDSGLITALPRSDSLNGTVILEGTSGTTELIVDVERENTRDQLTMNYFVAVADNMQSIASLDDFADDFEPEGVLVLAVGQKKTSLTLPIRADSKDEDQLERFLLEFSNFSSGNCPRCSFILSIRDDDEPGDDAGDGNEPPSLADDFCFPLVSATGKNALICL